MRNRGTLLHLSSFALYLDEQSRRTPGEGEKVRKAPHSDEDRPREVATLKIVLTNRSRKEVLFDKKPGDGLQKGSRFALTRSVTFDCPCSLSCLPVILGRASGVIKELT